MQVALAQLGHNDIIRSWQVLYSILSSIRLLAALAAPLE